VAAAHAELLLYVEGRHEFGVLDEAADAGRVGLQHRHDRSQAGCA
jgi:hypothetical protein